MAFPFYVEDSVSFEVAKTYVENNAEEGAMTSISVLDLGRYLHTSFHFYAKPYDGENNEFDEEDLYKYPCPSYEDRKCAVCGKSPDKLYLREFETKVNPGREREYGTALELVCFECVNGHTKHTNSLEYVKFVEIEDVAMKMWKLGVEWSPTTHRFFSWNDVFTVETVLLVAKRADWPLPKEIVWMILSYVFTLPDDAQEFCCDYATSYQEFNYKYSLIDHDEEDEDSID